jgi:hypothetical protein
MPIEGLPTESSAQGQGQAQASTSDATAKNTGAAGAGAGTQTAQQTEAQTDITQTPEFKAALTAAIEKKIPQLKKSLAKSITGEKEGEGSADTNDLQRQLSETQNRLRAFEAKTSVSEYLSDARHKFNIPAAEISGIADLVLTKLEYGDDGKPSNLKEAVENVKSQFPRLFANSGSNINANEGRNSPAGPLNMNDFIRQAHAGRN